MTDFNVIKRFEDKNGRLFTGFKRLIEKPENKEYKEYLLNRFENVESPMEAIIMLRNNISEVPKCKTCGKLMHITNNKDARKREYCSKKCMYTSEERNSNVSKGLYKTWADDSKREEILGKTNETCQRKWGVDYPTQCRKIVLKSERVQRNLERKKNYKTYRERFGVDRPLQNPEVHKRTQESYKRKTGYISPFQNPEVRKKLQEHFTKTYGGPTPFVSKEIKERLVKRNLELYGVAYLFELDEIQDKVKNTFLEKYGTTCSTKNPEVAAKVSKALKTPEVREKYRQTSLRNWGTESPMHVKEVREKIWNSIRKNKSLVHSKFEERIYKWILKRFGSSYVIRQYTEERYPWHCDFYIQPLDLFIEVQGMWTHGKHPFDKNNPEDLELLDRWKIGTEKSQFFKSAIRTWTITDVLKRETAKKNNLKYLEIFNYEIIEEVFWLEIERKITEWELSNKK